MNIWRILGIEPTTNEDLIQQAFTVRARKVLETADDGTSMAELQAAYRQAITAARRKNGTPKTASKNTGANVPLHNLTRITFGSANTTTANSAQQERTPTQGDADATAPEMLQYPTDATHNGQPTNPVESPAVSDALEFPKGDTTTAVNMSAQGSNATNATGGNAASAAGNAANGTEQPELFFPTATAQQPLSNTGADTPQSHSSSPSTSGNTLVFPSGNTPTATTNAEGTSGKAGSATNATGNAGNGSGQDGRRFSSIFGQQAPSQNTAGSPSPSQLAAPSATDGTLILPLGTTAAAAVSAAPPIPDMDGGDPLSGLLFPMAVGMDALPPIPTAQHPNAHQETLEDLCTRFISLAQSNADVEHWEEAVSSADFLSLQYNPVFLSECYKLCQQNISSPMATVLYTVYNMASSRMNNPSPRFIALRKRLSEYIALPVDDIPTMSFTGLKEQCAVFFAGVERLHKAPQSTFLWQQTFQTTCFIQLRHQPYFMYRLGEFLGKSKLSPEFLNTLAQVYIGNIRFSPCAEVLRSRLPLQIDTQTWSKPELYAADLLFDGFDDFYAAAENKIFSLLKQTAHSFKNSPKEEPWNYIFQQGQFAMLQHDPTFLRKLYDFVSQAQLPIVFWTVLSNNFEKDFLQLEQSANVTTSPTSLDVASETRRIENTQILQQLKTLADIQRNPRRRSISERALAFIQRHPWICGVALLYVAVALYYCSTYPLIGAVLLTLLVIFIF